LQQIEHYILHTIETVLCGIGDWFWRKIEAINR